MEDGPASNHLLYHFPSPQMGGLTDPPDVEPESPAGSSSQTSNDDPTRDRTGSTI